MNQTTAFPTGTITFLFSDIEGSTRLWEAHPDAMQAAVARHDALLRQAVQENDGYLFKTTGDGIAAAFAVAPDGLAAALAAQQALTGEPWSEQVVIRARMGLHTGAAELRGGDYFGTTLNRTARLMAAGHGGQILLSDVTHDLCRDTLPASVAMRPLGEYRLKDLTRPETVYQLAHPTLVAEFPALRTLDNPAFPNNLPQQLTSFIGREKPRAEVAALLGKVRLLTLTGSGGSGKTRLSLQAAADTLEQYPDGAWQVELAPLSDPALVPQTVASALGVKEQTGQSLTQTLTDHLKPRRLLLLLDNCEHMLQACATLASALLHACPQVKVLATSREPLGIAGETTYRVPTLTLPSATQATAATPASLSQFEAVRLFIERARAVKPDFAVTNANAPALAQLCCRLDGIPLALELAAARVRSLPVEQINDKLDSRFRLLTGGDRSALPRQQTLRALIDWSYDLLTDSEKTLLARLSVFAGGGTLAAAESVCGFAPLDDWDVLDLLTNLADKSLVQAEEADGASRYRMLETIRQYAAERLSGGDAWEVVLVRERHVGWCVTLVEEAQPQLTGPEQGAWLNRLESEHDNLRTALDTCAVSAMGAVGAGDSAKAALAGLRLVGSLLRFWDIRGYTGEGREQVRRALKARQAAASGAAGDAAIVKKATADALGSGGGLAVSQGDYPAARAQLKEALSLYHEVGDNSGINTILYSLGIVATMEGDYPAGRVLLEEALSLAREVGNKIGIADTLGFLGIVATLESDYPVARAQLEESLNLAREVGDKRMVAFALNNLGVVAAFEGDYPATRSLYAEGLRLSREAGDKVGVAYGLEGMATAFTNGGEALRAATLLAAAGALRESIGAPLLGRRQVEHDTEVAKARAEMGEEPFAAAWAEGRTHSWEQAVALALS